MNSTLVVPIAQKPVVADFESSYVANVDLTMILDYVAKKHPELVAQLPALALQYRQYMYLISLGQFKGMSVPSDAVDQIWHAHILHTVHYADFCQNVAGRFVDHNPFGDSTSQSERQGAVQTLLQASESVFGTNVFAHAKQSADCGYCGGCSNCSGDCGGLVVSLTECQGSSPITQAFAETSNCGECSSCNVACGE